MGNNKGVVKARINIMLEINNFFVNMRRGRKEFSNVAILQIYFQVCYEYSIYQF